MRPFRWGIIGPGRIARKFAACIQALPNSKVQAVASRSSKNLKELASALHAEVGYRNYEDLVRDESIDAVYIATPHRFHCENALLCLTNSKPALVEKAFTVNTLEAETLAAEAKKRGVFLMEAMWTRFLPIYRQIERWLKSRRIGDVQLVTSSLGFVARRNPNDRLLNPALAGGAVLDLGVYATAVSQFIFNKSPVSIKAHGFIGETGVDEAISASLDYGEGCLSQFACTFLAKTSKKVEVYGTRGEIEILPVYNSTEHAVLRINEHEKLVHLPHLINGFEYQIEEAQHCIKAGKLESPLMPLSASIDNLRILDEIRKQIGMAYPFEMK